MAEGRQDAGDAPKARDRRFAIAWHLAFAVMTAAGGGLLFTVGGLAPGAELSALAAGLAAALVGALLVATGGPSVRAATILLWTLAGSSAALMTGGIGGPLAAWCLAPLAAATSFRRSDGLALGAAAAVAAAAVATLGALFLVLPEAPAAARVWLSLLSLATVALGLGAGLITVQGAAKRQIRVSQRAALKAQIELDGQRDRERELERARASAEAQNA
ncbi:MAG: divJ, partial [Caulobacteraceae bacterium]|nr:divJ [Caulobacteraceae bacterium]